ncbi:MAG: chemotaxis protein CheW [Bacteroidales bacterium]|nr:chemotaxis protein CheW [Bacteroidales bacterium]MCM1415055.1 chemotaxis protein CheW [bacterium]MCM1422909.1 chemotaxis protein CheW [bacterium]
MAEELVKKEEADENDELLEETDSQKGMFMIFQAGKEFFGISISYVNEIIAMQSIAPIPDVEDYIKGLINLRGKIVPVIDIRTRFKMEPVAYTDRTCIIVIDVKETTIGLIVEKLAEVDTIAEDSIAPPPSLGRKEHEHSKYVYGLARTGDSVKLLIDPEKLIRQEDVQAAAAGAETE